MNKILGLAVSVVLLSFAACSKPGDSAGSAAGERPVPPIPAATAASSVIAAATPNANAAPSGSGPNPRFYTVQSKLELGGSTYVYVDLKDKLRSFMQNLQPWLTRAGLPPAAQIPVAMFVGEMAQSGFYDVQDLGISSVQEEEFVFRNRVFLHVPTGRKGLLALGGGEAHEFPFLNNAPANTALFASWDFDAPGLMKFIRDGARNVGGEIVLQSLEQQIKQGSTAIGEDIDKLIGSLSGNYSMVLTLDEQAKVNVPGAHMEVPLSHGSVMIGTKDASIYDTIKVHASAFGNASPEATRGNVKWISQELPKNPIASTVYIAADGGHLYISDSIALITTLASNEPPSQTLVKTVEYAKKSAQMPARGNVMWYATRELAELYSRLFLSAMSSPAEAQRMAAYIDENRAQMTGAFGVVVNEPDGIRIYAREPWNAGEMMALVSVVPAAVVAAISVPNFLEAQTRAKVARTRSDMRTMATALESYYIDTNAYPPTGQMYRLTSPVAYITNLFSDPFAAGDKATFQYINTQKGAASGWLLWSLGPDGMLALSPDLASQLYEPAQAMPNAGLRDLTYDPTNGTTSPGDVMRFKQ